MKVLLLAIGSYGDILPLAGLAREFLNRGHQVTLFTNPYFAKVIQHTGVEFFPVGTTEEYLTFINNSKLWHPYQGAKVVLEHVGPALLRETYHAMLPHIIHGSTILISSCLGWAARLLQETQGIPHVSAYYAPSNFFSGHAPPQGPNFHFPKWLPPWVTRSCWTMMNTAFIDPLIKPAINSFRHELGLSPVSQILHGWGASPDLVLGMFPNCFAKPQPDWPPNSVLTGFPLYDTVDDAVLPDTIQNFLDDYPNPIVCTPGSANKHGRTFFQESLKACQVLKRPGIFLTRFKEQLPLLPPSIQHFSYAPLSSLLLQSSALLHHGGIGTCAQALQAGIPQLIQPLGFDQYDNADRVEQLGIGRRIFPRDFNHSYIAHMLQDLLGSSHVGEQCRSISEQINATNGLSTAYETIEKYLIKP
ncbi:MAG: glycosyltransferase [Nitrospirales bacterium]